MDHAALLHSLMDAYHKKHDLRQVPIKIDFLRPLIEERGFADRIYWEKFDFDSKHVLALIKCYIGSMGVYAGDGNYARIQFSSGLNFCWSRFVICKEMLHCMLDDDQKDRVTNPADLLTLSELLVSESHLQLVKDFRPYNTEQWAEILALELLCPLELREKHVADYQKGSITTYQLALRYRIPEHYINLAMLDGHIEAIKQIRGDQVLDI